MPDITGTRELFFKCIAGQHIWDGQFFDQNWLNLRQGVCCGQLTRQSACWP